MCCRGSVLPWQHQHISSEHPRKLCCYNVLQLIFQSLTSGNKRLIGAGVFKLVPLTLLSTVLHLPACSVKAKCGIRAKLLQPVLACSHSSGRRARTDFTIQQTPPRSMSVVIFTPPRSELRPSNLIPCLLPDHAPRKSPSLKHALPQRAKGLEAIRTLFEQGKLRVIDFNPDGAVS